LLFSWKYEIAMPRLGVNIDHVATIRQARQTVEPDPVWAASLAELGGADGITIHLREDRRHIQDRDVRVLRDTVQVKLNLEMATAEEIVQIALNTKPEQVTLVPEKRQEITTEGGLDVIGNRERVGEVVKQLQDAGIEVSLFIDPETDHTGCYADATSDTAQLNELRKLAAAGKSARDAGLLLHMGHGLTYRNVIPVAQIEGTCELNIGHSIIARAVLVGFERAVREMKELIRG
jgi:pyridoxine 5-phosphate synthase